MTISKQTLLELEEEELRADLNDGFITKTEFEKRLRELKKTYSKRPVKDRDTDEDF